MIVSGVAIFYNIVFTYVLLAWQFGFSQPECRLNCNYGKG